MSLKIPAQTILNTYQRIEESLCRVLQVVPYCDNHKNVWSDYLVTVILEACSLLDSLWRNQSWKSSCVRNLKKTKNDLTMFDYFKYYGEHMELRWIVFWSEEPTIKYPFKGWSITGQYRLKGDQGFLDWWTAYNNLKHDRLQNRTEATLHIAVRAVSALFLAILRCEDCRSEIFQAGWLTGVRDRPECFLGEDSPSDKEAFVTAETKLFTYAVWWGKESMPQRQKWLGPASNRFVQWFAQQ